MTAAADNRPRFRAGADHVESWFVRANHPIEPKAVWLKATLLTRSDGRTLSQAWFSIFDGDHTAAFCQDTPLDEARFQGDPSGLAAAVGPLTLRVGSDAGSSMGELHSGQGRVAWDLRFGRLPDPLGRPMSLFPTARLVDAPLPKNKLLTPFPVATFSGRVHWNDQVWDLDGWIGMQGHNWGPSHSPEYAWGQCVFPDAADGSPVAVVEGVSGRVPLGRGVSPMLSMLVVRTRGREYRFDRILDLWRQRPELVFPRWSLRMKGPHAQAHLVMRSPTTAMVCLAYQNPARATSYCLNSKTASVRLRLLPEDGAMVEFHSEHGGALEFLRPQPEATVQPIV